MLRGGVDAIQGCMTRLRAHAAFLRSRFRSTADLHVACSRKHPSSFRDLQRGATFTAKDQEEPRFHTSERDPLYPVPDERRVEVDQEPEPFPRETEVGEK